MPYVASLATVLAALQLLDYLSPEYLTMSHRFWESTVFRVGFPLFAPLLAFTLVTAIWILSRRPRAVIPPLIGGLSLLVLDLGSALAVVSLVSVVVALYLSRRVQEYCVGLLAILFVVEAGSLLHWLVFVPLGLQDPFQAVTSLEQSLFYLAAQLSPFYMMAFTSAGIGVPLYHMLRGPPGREAASQDRSTARNQEYLALVLTMLLSVAVAVYPYLSKVNPMQLNPGVDITDYLADYYRIAADPSRIFTAMGGSRPVYYMVFLAFQRATSLDSLNAIQLLPMLLNPLLCASAFLLTRELTRDDSTATYAAFFTASGFTLSAGMYSYWLADMLMLSIIFLSLATLTKALRERSRFHLVAAIALGSLFVFTHPWTFVQYMAAVGGAVILTLIHLRSGESTHEAKWLIIYCLVVASTDVLKLLLLRGSVEGFATLGFMVTNLTTPTTFWLELLNSSRFYIGGYLTNMPLLTLTAIGLSRARERTVPNLILWVLVGATSLVYLIGNTVIKSRLLYNIPVGILAAYGVSYIDELQIDGRLKKMLKAAIIASLLSYLFRDMANLI